ncbi:MAG TPA: DUF3276 family protein [Bacteroidales bacterium]|nr:DUF3276 family protein [Bacteroidales bacterium]
MNDEGQEKKEERVNQHNRDEIYSKVVRAGKRTYFFDVKATRKNDYYLTITESKKRFGKDGKFFYEKHKLFLYKEDFDKFADSLEDVVNYIREANPQPIDIEDEKESANSYQIGNEVSEESKDFTSVEFDDLDDTAS